MIHEKDSVFPFWGVKNSALSHFFAGSLPKSVASIAHSALHHLRRCPSAAGSISARMLLRPGELRTPQLLLTLAKATRSSWDQQLLN